MSSKVWTIIGSGFGLYGYLPALAEVTDDTIILPERYRDKLRLRPELSYLEQRVTWNASEHEIYRQVDGIILAVPPNIQHQKILELINYEQIRYFLLEKPVAASPRASKEILELITSNGKHVRIAYTFLYTKWFNDIRLPSPHDGGTITINWSFRAHHFANQIDTWKKRHSLGGGPLRFYGIHLLALTASLGYDTASASVLNPTNTDSPTCWHVELLGAGLPPCELNVHTDSDEMRFKVTCESGSKQKTLLDLEHPFALEQSTSLDLRVSVLSRLVDEIDNPTANSLAIYDCVNALWESIEIEMIS